MFNRMQHISKRVNIILMGHIFKDIKKYTLLHNQYNITTALPKSMHIGSLRQGSRNVTSEKYVWRLNES